MLLKTFLLVIVTFLYCAQITHQVPDHCYAKDGNQYKYFSYLTSYATVRSTLTSFAVPESCTPIYAVAFIKNGITYMSEQEIERVKTLFSIKDQIIAKNPSETLCEEDLSILKNWNLQLDETRANSLVESGKVEQRQLAQRLKEKLSAVLSSNSKDSYEFQTAAAKKYKDSALVFTNELLGSTFPYNIDNGITESEMLRETFQNEANNVAEMESFIRSELVQNTFKKISTVLGLPETLSSDTIIAMYKVCGYENAWGDTTSPAFCAAFSQDDLKVMEYIFDLKNYYEYGYGNTQNENSRVLVIKDILKKLSDASDGKYTKKATFYFSNGQPISAALAKLGLYRDQQPITSNNYEIMKDSRLWRSSTIDSFSSNLLAVIYSCSNNEDKRVGFYHNENLLKVPFCPDQFCTLTKLKEEYKAILENDGIPKPKEKGQKPDVEKKKEGNPVPDSAKEEKNSGSVATLFSLGVLMSVVISLL